MPDPAVSIVLPAYNHERFVAASVDSVLAQTWTDWELIAIDDGSSDSTLAVLQRYADPRIRVLTQANAGSHRTINRGLALARGRYLAVLNSDDVYHPERLRRLVAVARGHGDPLFAFTAVRLIDEDGQPVTGPHWWRQMYEGILRTWDETPAGDPERALLALLWGNAAVSTSNFFFSRSVLQACGGLRHFRYVLDWEYALRVATRLPGAVAFVRDEPLLDYRLHGANTILGGAIRNHLEAAYILRRALEVRDGGRLRRAVRRVHYLERFIRKRESHLREEQRNRLAVDNAVQGSLLRETQAHVGKLEQALRAGGDELQRQFEVTGRLRAEIEDQRNALLGREAQVEKLEQALREADDELQRQRAVTGRQLTELGAARAATEAATVELQAVRDLYHLTAAHVAKLDAIVEAERALRVEAQAAIAAMASTRSWRYTSALRRSISALAQLRAASRRLALAVRQPGGLPAALRRCRRILREEGVRGVVERLARGTLPAMPPPEAGADRYAAWIERQTRTIEALRARAGTLLGELPLRPLFSVVVPVFNTDPGMLYRMLESVRSQIYPHWQLCVADDASTVPAVRRLLESAAAGDARIRICWRPVNGHICAASNSALELATGEYVVFLDHDDELAPHALLAIARWLARHPDAELLYSDDDKIEVDGRRHSPLFKPDWSPALAWTQNYVGHLVCARRRLIADVGGLREGFEGAQDYDLVLRLATRARTVHHLPDVLYHWRMHAGSTSANAGAKPYAHEAGRRAAEAFLAARYGERLLRVDDGEHLFTYSPRFLLARGTVVSIIVPTRDKAELLEACVRSILTRSSWPDYEVLIVDNQSAEAATFAAFDRLRALDARVRIAPAPIDFNWSRLNNLAARQCAGGVLIFLNNDTEVITPDWIERLAEVALLPDVATVGAMLLYGDGTIQHAGVVVGMGGWADHVYKGCLPVHHPSPFVSPVTTRNVLANTGACMAVERAKFDRLGGFDEAFVVCGSDVELGLRAHRAGMQNVFLASARLLHHESKTRGPTVPENDFAQSARKYAPFREDGDPFYSANLDPASTTPTIRA
jgi:glycosyltransferase involved in cell wall biosynthesis